MSANRRNFADWKLRTADAASNFLASVLNVSGANTYRNVVNALWERQPHYARLDISLELPDRVTPDASERPIVERIFAAYRQARRDQKRNEAIFLPAGGWQNVVETAYAYLIEADDKNDISKFHYFLANFAAWDQPTGIDESSVFRKLAASDRKRQHFEQHSMGRLVEWWKTLEGNGRDIHELVMPRHGNQSGFRVEGRLITPNAIYGDFYARLLAGFVNHQRLHDVRPILGELGGGFGRLYYFLAQNLPTMTYLGFDLPECLSCAAYYLMLSFPDKRFLLYGEGDLTPESLHKYDIILRPSFEIGQVPASSTDLFINENSLGVMMPDLVGRFVGEICRISEAFWHRNHELRRNPFENGITSLVNREYPIDIDRFQLVARCCDIERLLGDTMSSSKNDMYWYYYLRRSV